MTKHTLFPTCSLATLTFPFKIATQTQNIETDVTEITKQFRP